MMILIGRISKNSIKVLYTMLMKWNGLVAISIDSVGKAQVYLSLARLRGKVRIASDVTPSYHTKILLA